MTRTFSLFAFLMLLLGCADERQATENTSQEARLTVTVGAMTEGGYHTTTAATTAAGSEGEQSATRVVYGGAGGEQTAFQTGDVFGLFVVDEEGAVKAANVKVYCSGFDNAGATVWSIYKEGEAQGNSSNSPMADILGKGTRYLAYYPYDEGLSGATDADDLKAYVATFINTLPKDQSSSFTDNDLLVASNIEGAEYGEVKVEGQHVGLTFAHALAMLKFSLPQGAVRYDYFLGDEGFTPYLKETTGGRDEYRYLFKAGGLLDICIKYVYDGKLYRFATDKWKLLSPIMTEAGHCYTMNETAIKVPYDVAVDMGTSVMWASFNLGAEDEQMIVDGHIAELRGSIVMWGVNKDTGSYGSAAYTQYCNSFADGIAPKQLPIGYCWTADPCYDAATYQWGGAWRTPTAEEWEELFRVCSCAVSGGIITLTSKKTNNTLKIKQVGYYDSATPAQTTTGYYWSSSASTQNSTKALSTIIDKSARIHTNASRYTGLPVRPVFTK